MNFKPANIPVNDAQRVKAVKRTGVLDESKTELYDIYCFLAKEITGCPSKRWFSRWSANGNAKRTNTLSICN